MTPLVSFAERRVIIMIKHIGIDKLYPFEEVLFSLDDNDEMEMLIDSIKEFGVLQPIIVRKASYGYEVISGNRRLYAACMADYETVPAIVMDLTDEEAIAVMVDSNLHRNILPSEKAFAYKAKYEALESLK